MPPRPETVDTLEAEASDAIAREDYRLGASLLVQAADRALDPLRIRALLAEAASVYAVAVWWEAREIRDQ